MPSTYAHDRFGSDVLRALPQHTQAIIREHEELFRIGLHGPDILFYANPLVHNSLGRLGGLMHQQAGQLFFERAGRILQKGGFDRAELAYLYGFLCHFALDVACHGMVAQQMASLGLTHDVIEGEFEYFLLEKDGKNPPKTDLVSQLHPTQDNAAVIARYFPTLTPKQIQHAIEAMVFFHHLLFAPHAAKRQFLYGALKVIGKYDSFRGHIIPDHADLRCQPSNEALYHCYQNGLKLAESLINGFLDTVRGEADWAQVYHTNFESIVVYQNEQEELL